MNRTIYVAIDEDKFVGCENKKLIEKFVANRPEPKFIIIVQVVVKDGHIETIPVNTPNIDTSKVDSAIERAIGQELRMDAKSEKLGIPILTEENFNNFPGFKKVESRQATVIKDQRRGHITVSKPVKASATND